MRTKTTGSAYVAGKRVGEMLSSIIELIERKLKPSYLKPLNPLAFMPGTGLPLLVIDEDFYEFLEERSATDPMPEAELMEYWAEWEKEHVAR